MDEATGQMTTEESVEVSTAAALFGNDDLGRLQNILLGDHARQITDRIDTLEQALLGVIDDLRTEMRERTEALDARIDAEAETRTSGVTNLTSRLDAETKERTKALKDLTKDLRSTESDVHAALDAASSGLSGHVEDLRTATEKLAATDAELGDTKVDRSALAALLSAAAAGLEDVTE